MIVTIEELRVNKYFRFLWLKYVTGINLNYHCAKCLVGNYSTLVNPFCREYTQLYLDEFQAEYFYLCGVTAKWSENFHLAFKYSEGDHFEVERNGVYIKISNAVEIPIIEPDFTVIDNPFKYDAKYNTCRNWWFAHYLNNELNIMGDHN